MNMSDRLYKRLKEYQVKRQALLDKGERIIDGTVFAVNPIELRALEDFYRGYTNAVMDAMRKKFGGRGEDARRMKGCLKLFERSVNDFLQYETTPETRKNTSKAPERRAMIKSKEQCFDMLTNGTLTKEELKEFIRALDA